MSYRLGLFHLLFAAIRERPLSEMTGEEILVTANIYSAAIFETLDQLYSPDGVTRDCFTCIHTIQAHAVRPHDFHRARAD